LYKDFWANFNGWVFTNLFRSIAHSKGLTTNDTIRVASRESGIASSAAGGKVGRNDPCLCGSGKKYKHCHGK
jgi:uncharacterized protein YchJ